MKTLPLLLSSLFLIPGCQKTEEPSRKPSPTVSSGTPVVATKAVKPPKSSVPPTAVKKPPPVKATRWQIAPAPLSAPGSAGLGATPPRLPTVIPGASSVFGKVEVKAVRAAVLVHRREVDLCYRLQLMKKPTLQGAVRINFLITPAGKARACEVDKGADLLGIGRCICKRVPDWTFPKPRGGLAAARFSWTFHPGTKTLGIEIDGKGGLARTDYPDLPKGKVSTRIFLVELTATGIIDTEAARRTISAHYYHLLAACSTARPRGGAFEDTVKLDLIVGPKGGVLDCSVKKPAKNRHLGRLLCTRMTTWTMPEPKGKRPALHLTLRFTDK